MQADLPFCAWYSDFTELGGTVDNAEEVVAALVETARALPACPARLELLKEVQSLAPSGYPWNGKAKEFGERGRQLRVRGGAASRCIVSHWCSVEALPVVVRHDQS